MYLFIGDTLSNIDYSIINRFTLNLSFVRVAGGRTTAWKINLRLFLANCADDGSFINYRPMFSTLRPIFGCFRCPVSSFLRWLKSCVIFIFFWMCFVSGARGEISFALLKTRLVSCKFTSLCILYCAKFWHTVNIQSLILKIV